MYKRQIIDLQNNGGGSMEEAVQLTGSFIDIGPIAIMNNKQGNKQTIKDPNRGSIYTGPLVVSVSYTHLDVYKRQRLHRFRRF